MTTATRSPAAAGVAVPDAFRFGDVNPFTGRRYLASRFRLLPPWVQYVVDDDLGLTPVQWDALVARGEVAEVVRPAREFSLTRFYWTARRRRRNAGSGDCRMCGGSGAYVPGTVAGSKGLTGPLFSCPCGGAW